jgi:hypothetical protein
MGFFETEIIFPSWLLDAPAEVRAAVLDHEQQHIDARDPLLLLVGFLLVALVPWNVPLWWQLHRLRFAIEVDCDSRVTLKSSQRVPYAEALLSVAGRGRRSGRLGAVGVGAYQSNLERRIRILLPEHSSYRPAMILAGACGVVALYAVLLLQVPRASIDDWSANKALAASTREDVALRKRLLAPLSSPDTIPFMPEVLIVGDRYYRSPGQLWFDRDRLSTVVDMFNRFNTRKLVIADPSLAELRIGGSFEARDNESFVVALERTLRIQTIPARAERKAADVVWLVGSGVRIVSEPAPLMVNFRIPPSAFSDSMRAFAAQSGMAVLYRNEPREVPQISTPEVEGRMTPETALARLLKNTECRFQQIQSQTVAVHCLFSMRG